MEILRLNILPQEELLRRDAFKRAAFCCAECGTPVKFDYTAFADAHIIREEKECSNCGHKSSEDFVVN